MKLSQLNKVYELLRRSKPAEARNLASRLRQRFPDSAEALFALSVTSAEVGLFADAETGLRALVSSHPQNTTYLLNLGTLYAKQARLLDAERVFSEVLLIAPSDATAIRNLVAVRTGGGNWTGVIKASRQGLFHHPRDVSLTLSLARALLETRDLSGARKATARALEISADNPEAWNLQGLVFSETGDFDAAVECFDKALELDQKNVPVLNNLGNLMLNMGDKDRALTLFRRAVEVDIDSVKALYSLALISEWDDVSVVESRLRERMKKKQPDADLILTRFALGKIADRLGRFPEAYQHFSEANKVQRSLSNYDIDTDRRLFADLVDVSASIDRTEFSGRDLTEAHPIPIFILGMPRSGTSLVEQVLACHPSVSAGGELDLVSRFGKALSVGQRPLSAVAVAEFRHSYLEELQKYSAGSRLVTDKMPLNFRYIPLIALALPEAKIVHTVRDPRAVIWSNFANYFPARGMSFTNSLDDLQLYYELYVSYMDGLSARSRGQMLDLYYERFTGDLSGGVGALLAHVGLDWHDACLEPHKATSVVRTTSTQQIRRPVYQGSSSHWENYSQWVRDVGPFSS